MKFIKLTHFGTYKPIYVNLDNVAHISKNYEDKTVISFTDNEHYIFVTETVKEIFELPELAMKAQTP